MTNQMVPMLDVADFLARQPDSRRQQDCCCLRCYVTVTCGNRTDLFKAQRRHHWVSMGLDMAYGDNGRYGLALIFMCSRCWTGHAKQVKKAA